MRFFRVYYEHYSSPGTVYSVRIPMVGNDPEYAWRMSPMNVPYTKFIKAEEEIECTLQGGK